ncbi:MAG: formate C-acetyltransferase/glycerol dehydratase family glycyl radical enzyme [Lachnospiraceae bacterium]|nr:formate C-acetyltransferase/glycerol dehydratase family glycyl radical enzyme [Lachnospiraceae bacterium]
MRQYLEFVPQNHDLDMERISRLQQKMANREASICSERAVLYTESFRRTEGEPYILRKAKAFAHTLANMSIYIEPDSLIFGNQACSNFAAPVFPEYSIDWVVDELDGSNGTVAFDQRSGDVFQCSEKVKEDIRTIAPYWHGRTHQDEVASHLTDEIRAASRQGVLHLGGISNSGDGHIVPKHELILEKGFRALIQEAQEKLLKGTLSKEQRDFYQSVIISLEGALAFFKRYEAAALEMAEQEQKEARRKELLEMAKMAATMMEQPARSFWEGCEVCYMVHMLQMIESNGHSFCYGRFDQYMLDLYEKDLAAGRITREKALEYITHMFIMNSSHNKVRGYGHTRFSQGYPLYSNLVVGGYKKDGTDGTNELSYLCIEAMNLTALAEPNFSMRYNLKTPDSLLRLAAKLIRTGCGMPSMFNDEVAVKGLEDLGIPRHDALDYCPIGCVETGVPGMYGHRATGMTYVNWGKVLEIVLYHGLDPRTGIRLIDLGEKLPSSAENRDRTPDTASREPIPESKSCGSWDGIYRDYASYEELWAAWEKALRYYSDMAVESDSICDRSLEIYDADPFASCFIDNCMEKGKTLKAGGCKYDVISQSNIGPNIVGNSLATIKKYIFEKKTLSWKELMDALASDWKGKEGLRVRKIAMNAPKFGNDDDYVDTLVSDVYWSYLKLLPGYRTERSGKGPELSCYTMSTSNITSYVPNGMDVGATPDGRYAGTPLNEGCSPTQGTDICGPTAVINSVSKLPNYKVAAGQLLNMRFAAGALAGEDNLDKFIAFLKTSVIKGIYHNQFNVLSTDVLRAAQRDPESHRDLIVRVAGYCAQFVSLMEEAQEAIIARTENEW